MLFFQCPVIPEFFFAHDDYQILENIIKEMKSSNITELAEAYKYAFRDPEAVTASINYYRCAFQYPESSRALQKPVNVPVKQIFGTGDKYLSMESARGTKKFVKNLEETYIDGVGHWVQMEAANKVNQAIENYLSKMKI